MIKNYLDLADFRVRNVDRSMAPKSAGGFDHRIDDWTPAEWGCALAGETGELCNMLKKIRRGENVDLKEVAHEIGDVFAYLDLVAASLGIDLEKAIIDKWNVVSERRGWHERIP